MVNGVSSSYVPYNGYPHNATGATQVTKDIASYCYDTQRPNIAKNYAYLTSDNKQSLTWSIVGVVTSFLSLLAISALKRGRP